MAVFRVHRTSMKGAYVFIFLISLRTLAWASSSNNHDSTCIDGCTGFCKSATDVNLHKKAVWICRGRFGRLDLNCSGNQTIKTSQMISCQAAIIYRPTEAEDEEVSSMFMHKVNCTAGRTDCRNEVLANRLGLWQCHWDKLCLLIDYRGYIQLRSVQERQGSLHYFNGSIQGSRNKTTKVLPHELFPNWPQDTNCSGQTVPCVDVTIQEYDERESSRSIASWTCPTSSVQVNISVSCKVFYEGKDTLSPSKVCCDVFIQKANEVSAEGPALCSMNHSKRTLDCKWQRASLHVICLSKASGDVWRDCQAIYSSECKIPNNNTNPHTCPDPVPSTAVTPTNASLATGKGSSRFNSSKITPNWPQDTNCSGQTDPVLSTAVTPTNASLATGKGSSRFNSSKITPNWPQDTTCSGQTVPCVDVTIQELKQENFTANDPVLSTAVTPTNASLATGKGSSRANSSKIIDDVRNYLSQFKCNASSIQTLLLQLEGTLRRWLAEILNSSSNQTSLCIRDEIIDITVKVLADSNETITVPGPSEVASFSLPPNSIATKNGSIGILTAAFKFDRQCNDSQGLTLQEGNSNGPSTLRSPIITVLAASPQGDIKDLRANATLTFRTKNAGPSSPQCVFLNSTSRSWSSDGMYLKENLSTNYTTCLSEHLTSFAVLINYKDKTRPLDPGEKLALNIITKIGCGIGIFCLIACILIFTCIRGLSATRFRIHLNLCIALTAALVLFISGIEATQIKGVCIAVAIMLHYFFTASFSWMCIEAVHLFTKIVSVFNVQVRRLRYYVAVGWGLPAVIVAISVSANFNGYSTPDKCWLTLEGSLIWAFLAPVIIIVLINVAVLIAVIFVRLTLKGNILTPNEDKKFVAALKTVVVLFPLLGLSWLFGLMAILTQNRAFLYPFAILSPFQGVFIFLFQIIGNREVRASVRSARERHSTNSSLRLEQKKREKKANKVPGNKNTEAVCLMMRLTATKERNKNKMEPTHV
ncbi:adhesion G protein-coupled receptor L2-like isoform X2 [Acropora millepora]|uniref:adhesion G protein-coupled receptor L2-like isoform X2 n=1 Tax=Acropora millepora TaxID=45264 RepID=UPI001CF3D63B|nr:adhesion G protein-coupled receptor L2-like isoform X2 [Acropora millepora]